MKNKIAILILGIMLMSLMIGCTATEEDIKFYLNEGIDTIELNTDYEDPGATAIVFGLKRKSEVLENTIDTTKLGEYHILYEYSYQDISLQLLRIVTVVDETAPIISLNPGVDTIKSGDIWIDAYVTVTDNSELDVRVSVSGSVDTSTIGIYKITYTATDSSNNISIQYRYVHVI